MIFGTGDKMQDKSALGRALATVRDLRKRCPWDRAQTRETLRPYLVEEALELDHALGEGDVAQIRGEVSDLLLHLAFQLVIAEERREFTLTRWPTSWKPRCGVAPHLFDLGKASPGRKSSVANARDTCWQDSSQQLPELLMAFRLQQRAAAVGSTGPTPRVLWRRSGRNSPKSSTSFAPAQPTTRRRIRTECTGTISSERSRRRSAIALAVVNLARKAGVQPGPALDRANRKFRQRFEAVERLASDRGIDVGSAGLDVLDGLWNEVKARDTTDVSAAGRQ